MVKHVKTFHQTLVNLLNVITARHPCESESKLSKRQKGVAAQSEEVSYTVAQPFNSLLFP